MAISFVRQAWGIDEAGTQTSINVSLAVDGQNPLLLVGTRSGNGTAAVTSVTYGGEALTKINEQPWSSTTYAFWYKLNPKSGTNNITITRPATGGLIMGLSACLYNGVRQDSFPNDADLLSLGGVTSGNLTLTSTVDKCWGASFCYTPSGVKIAAHENLTFRNTTSYQYPIGDTNGVISPAGNIVMGCDLGSAGTLGMISVVFEPAKSAGGGSHLLNFL